MTVLGTPSSSKSLIPSISPLKLECYHTNKESWFFWALASPYTPHPSFCPPLKLSRSLRELQSPHKSLRLSPSSEPNPLYRPFGLWAWVHGLPLQEVECHPTGPLQCPSLVKRARVVSEGIDNYFWFMPKTFDMRRDSSAFNRELSLYERLLKPLQGIVVPTLINVWPSNTAAEDTVMAFEPPHESFWVHASPDMPESLKALVVKAYEKLHGRGVLHGSVELKHMLISGNRQVYLINFENGRTLANVKNVPKATAADLAKEMRKVRYKLDYRGARTLEGRRQMANAPYDWKNPPIDVLEFAHEWASVVDPPRRFVMPLQSRDQLVRAVQEFVGVVDRWERHIKLLREKKGKKVPPLRSVVHPPLTSDSTETMPPPPPPRRRPLSRVTSSLCIPSRTSASPSSSSADVASNESVSPPDRSRACASELSKCKTPEVEDSLHRRPYVRGTTPGPPSPTASSAPKRKASDEALEERVSPKRHCATPISSILSPSAYPGKSEVSSEVHDDDWAWERRREKDGVYHCGADDDDEDDEKEIEAMLLRFAP